MQDCLFCKITRGDIPSKLVYEDRDLFAFQDIRPIAPVHFLITPKLHLDSLQSCTETHQALLGKLLLHAPILAKMQGLDGFRTMINTGREGGQEVFHLHLHVFGGGKNLPRT